MDAILAFHSLDDGGSVVSFAPAAFERLLDLLLEEGVAIVALDELLRATDRAPDRAQDGAAGGARHRVALTFDDGMASVHSEALPRLARRRLPFLVYCVSERLGGDNRWPGQPAGIPAFPLMDAVQLRELVAAGGAVGGHTATHADCRGLAPAALERELDGSRRALEAAVGAPVRHFAWPYGRCDAAALAYARPRFASLATTRLAYLPEPARRDVHALPRLDAWYLREPERRLPLFAPRTRAWIAWRALLRRLKGVAYGS